MPDQLWELPAAMLLMGYLFGSIPFGLILTRLTGGGDLRAIGSGNIGATNVLRTGNKGLAALTLLLDVAKGAAPVLIAWTISPLDAALAAIGAFFGHCYPVWLKFRGGKGVATLGGVWLALVWQVGLIYAAVWIATLLVTRISSLAGILAAVSGAIAALVIAGPYFFILGLAFALVVLWKHRSNIGRLVKDEEPRVGSKKARDARADAQ